MSTGPREIDYENFKGDIFGKTFCLTKDEITGEYFFDYVETPEGFDLSKFKFFRVMGKTTAEVEAELRKILKLAPPTAETSGETAGSAAAANEGEGGSGAGDGGAPTTVLLPRRGPAEPNLFEPGIRPPRRPATSGMVGIVGGPTPAETAAREARDRERSEREAAAKIASETGDVSAAEALLRGRPPATGGPSVLPGVGEANIAAATAVLEGRPPPSASAAASSSAAAATLRPAEGGPRVEEAAPPPRPSGDDAAPALSAASSSASGPPPPPPPPPSSPVGSNAGNATRGGKGTRRHKKQKHTKSKSHKHRK